MSEVIDAAVTGQVPPSGFPAAEAAVPVAVPARTIAPPRSISPQAQASLAPMPFATGDYPPLDDHDAWRAVIAMSNQGLVAMLADRTSRIAATVDAIDVDGVPVFDITPADLSPNAGGRIYLDIHGGALTMGAGEGCRVMGLLAVQRSGVRTWTVDYRVPPDHPYPAALDDCLTVYRALLRDYRPEDIVIGGSSAGGNLAAATVLRARDEGLPLPRATVLISPEVDLTESGDSFVTNHGIDTILTRSLKPQSNLYAGGHDLAHPYLSPLFGDFTKGFPPTFLQAGTRDLFLSNTVRMHRALLAAGVPAELHVFEGMPHGGFGGAPEDAELDAQVRRFIDAHWTTPTGGSRS